MSLSNIPQVETLRLMIASSNPHKLAEFKLLFAGSAVPVASPAELGHSLPDVEETGETIGANAELKAKAWATATGQWTLADDTGLEVEALGGRPGVYSARFAGPDATADQNRQKLLGELSGFSGQARAARFVCVLALANPRGEILLTVAGTCEGEILTESEGEAGFGYDKLFFVHQAGKTLAQMSAAETAQYSHRARAVQSLLLKLRSTMNPSTGN